MSMVHAHRVQATACHRLAMLHACCHVLRAPSSIIVRHPLPPYRQVHFVMAACENMVSSHATRPGDIHEAANGKTVEVGSSRSSPPRMFRHSLVTVAAQHSLLQLGWAALLPSSSRAGLAGRVSPAPPHCCCLITPPPPPWQVNDTDAEGRLTLADALWYAQVGWLVPMW